MENLNLYLSQLERCNKGIRFNSAQEIKDVSGKKPGGWAEIAIAEAIGDRYHRRRKECTVKRANGREFWLDGYIEDLDCYVESKNFSFFSSGTASEKLYSVFVKFEEYDKQTLLVFCGEHERLSDDASKVIWDAFHNPHSCNSKSVVALVNSVRHKIRDIVKLSELHGWIIRNRS